MPNRVEWGINLDVSRLRKDAQAANKDVQRLTASSDKLQKEFDDTGKSNKALGEELNKTNKELAVAQDTSNKLSSALVMLEGDSEKAAVATRGFGVAANVTGTTLKALATGASAAATSLASFATVTNLGSSAVFRPFANIIASILGSLGNLTNNLKKFFVGFVANIKDAAGRGVVPFEFRLQGLILALSRFGIVLAAVPLLAFTLALGQAVIGISQTRDGLRRIDEILVPLNVSWDSFIGRIQRATDNFRGFGSTIRGVNEVFGDIFRGIDALVEGIIQNIAQYFDVNLTNAAIVAFTRIRVFAQNTFTNILIFFQTKWLKALETQNRIFGLFSEQIANVTANIDELRGSLVDVSLELADLSETLKEPEFVDLGELWNDIGGGVNDTADAVINLNNQLRILRAGDNQARAALRAQIAEQRVILENRQLDAQTRRDAGRLALSLDLQRLGILRQEKQLEIERLEILQSLNATSQEEEEQLDALREQLINLDAAQANFERRIQSVLNTLPLITQELPKAYDAIIDTTLNADEEVTRSGIKAAGERAKAAQNEAGLDKRLQQERLERARSTAQGISAISTSLFGEQAGITRGLIALEQALGLAKAISAAPPPLNFATIATFIAQFAQVFATLRGARSALGPSFEKGGVIPIGGRRHSAGGTRFFGSDGSTFEAEAGEAVVLNRGATSALMPLLSQINQAHGGRSLFADGGSFLQGGGRVSPAGFNVDELASKIGIEVASRIDLNPRVSVEDITTEMVRTSVIDNNARF